MDVALCTLGTMVFLSAIHWLAGAIAARLKGWSKYERHR